jgi:hypothetical protein
MDTTVTTQGNIFIAAKSWAALIEDVAMIINQGCSNFEPEPVTSWSVLERLPDAAFLTINKVYLDSRTRTIRMEAKAGTNLLDICVGKILKPTLLTGRILGDLICASRSYREDGIKLNLELL